MPKYIVNLDKGWNQFAFGDTFESDSAESAKAAEQGYLVAVLDAPTPAPPTWGDPDDVGFAPDDPFTKEAKAKLKK